MVTCAPTCILDVVLYRFAQKRISSQVKSSSNFNGGRARRLWGARRRERSGWRDTAQLAWLDYSPEPGLHPSTSSSS